MKARTIIASALVLAVALCAFPLSALAASELGTFFSAGATPIEYYEDLMDQDLDSSFCADALPLTDYAGLARNVRTVSSLPQAPLPQAPLPQASLPQASLPQASLPQASLPQASLPQASERIVLAEATPLTSSEMQDMRGGFIDPSGLIYNFAVDVQTALNGVAVFTRSLTISPSGSGGQFQAAAHASLLPKNFPSNFNVTMIDNGKGVTVTDTSGNSSTVLNQSASGAPTSVIMNTSSNTNLSQSVNVTLTLKNVSSVMNFVHATTQAAMGQHAAMRSLGF